MKPTITIVIFFLAFWGCDESLPPRDEPAQVLNTTFRVLYPGTVIVREGLPAGMTGAFSSSVENIYGEVLQDTQRVRLDVEVWLKDQPLARATIHATSNDLISGRLLSGSILTLGVHDVALVEKQWSHQTDAGVPFWSYATMRRDATPAGEVFYESSPLTFVGTATVQVFKNVQPVKIPSFEFILSYRVFDITIVPPTVEQK